MLRPRKQLLLKLGVFLLLGAVVNVAVAWGLATCVRYVPTPSRTQRYQSTEFEIWIVFGSRAIGSEYVHSWNTPCTSFGGGEWEPPANQQLPVFPPWWRGIRTKPESRFQSIAMDARGWPMLAMHARFEFVEFSVETNVWHGGLVLWETGVPRNSSTPSQCALPLIPLWPDFAINTLFYAALLWAMWIAPGKIRRFVRVRGQRCPACGYKIDSAPGIGPRCSECGAVLPLSLSVEGEGSGVRVRNVE